MTNGRMVMIERYYVINYHCVLGFVIFNRRDEKNKSFDRVLELNDDKRRNTSNTCCLERRVEHAVTGQ